MWLKTGLDKYREWSCNLIFFFFNQYTLPKDRWCYFSIYRINYKKLWAHQSMHKYKIWVWNLRLADLASEFNLRFLFEKLLIVFIDIYNACSRMSSVVLTNLHLKREKYKLRVQLTYRNVKEWKGRKKGFCTWRINPNC